MEALVHIHLDKLHDVLAKLVQMLVANLGQYNLLDYTFHHNNNHNQNEYYAKHIHYP